MTRMNYKYSLVACAMFILTSCSTSSYVNDPIEPVNRAVYKFNDTLDSYIFKPIAKGYNTVTPRFARKGVDNFFDNLSYPVVFTNQFLQGKFKLGFQDTGRFLINSTFGIAGLFDVADKFGLVEHKEDFGQTFAIWGVSSGPYIVLPLLGSTNVRDGLGSFASSYIDPLGYEYFKDHRAVKNRTMAIKIIEARAQILDYEGLITGDKYIFVRDAYMQNRKNLIFDGKESEKDPFLDD